jgi:spore coat protein H
MQRNICLQDKLIDIERLLGRIVISLFCSLSIISCEKIIVNKGDSEDILVSSDSITYNSDWTFITHGNAVVDYSTIFPQNTVNLIEISMTASKWSSIRTNMKSLFGNDFGISGGGVSAPGGAGADFPDTETDYVDVLIKFNGRLWKNVGFRLKGNSSLQRAWSSGIYKLPFRLNFDKFEDKYPGTKNQHFYGFKELSFSPAFGDQSLIREKITPDIFRLAGIAAAQTAFYRVYIDFGSGSKYCGVYTAVEIPDDSMIDNQFGEEEGNIYKPESKFSNFLQSEFEKKNNEIKADYSDVKVFISALTSTLRTSNPVQWRTKLEAAFNIHDFIKYLAVNNAIANWDSYGNMAHNFYLYNNSLLKLTWIPWDHNEALSGSTGITGTVNSGGSGMNHNPLSLSMNEVSSSWPLIRYLADDPIYLAEYKVDLKSFNNNVFTELAMNAIIDKYYSLISIYAIGTEGEKTSYTYLTSNSSFTNAFSDLKKHITARKTLISGYVP